MPPVKKQPRQRGRTFIRAWRKYRGLSQEELASRVNMSRENWSKIESGKVPYNQDMLELAALALGCRAGDLLDKDPLSDTSADELKRLMGMANDAEQRQIIAVAKTLLETKK